MDTTKEDKLQHTRKPWSINQNTPRLIYGNGRHILTCVHKEDAIHTIECVNACMGMQKPDQEIKTMREKADNYDKATRDMYSHLLVNALRFLTAEQRANLVIDLYGRSELKTYIDKRISKF